MANVLITQGTQSPVATDLVGTVNYQVVKLDMGTAGTTNLFGGTANALPVDLNSGIAGEDLTNNVLGVLTKPVTSASYAPQEYISAGAATGGTIKTSAGNVFSLDVTSGTTAIRYFQLFNQATVPVLGQTAVQCYALGSVPAGGISRLTLDSQYFFPSYYFSTGIAWAISSTNGTLGTASVTAADYNVHVKWY